MQIIRDEIQLCADCMIAAVNGDFTGLDYHYGASKAAERMEAITVGLDKLGPHLVPAFDSETGKGYSEFSSARCECCETKLAGSRHEFAILG